VHVEKFLCAEPERSQPRPDGVGPAREGSSRTPSMYADEKSDEAVVTEEATEQRKATSGGVVEGRASPRGTADRRPWFGH